MPLGGSRCRQSASNGRARCTARAKRSHGVRFGAEWTARVLVAEAGEAGAVSGGELAVAPEGGPQPRRRLSQHDHDAQLGQHRRGEGRQVEVGAHHRRLRLTVAVPARISTCGRNRSWNQAAQHTARLSAQRPGLPITHFK
eukprot:6213737-Pleurochrysis_carterae.AAC.6